MEPQKLSTNALSVMTAKFNSFANSVQAALKPAASTGLASGLTAEGAPAPTDGSSAGLTLLDFPLWVVGVALAVLGGAVYFLTSGGKKGSFAFARRSKTIKLG